MKTTTLTLLVILYVFTLRLRAQGTDTIVLSLEETLHVLNTVHDLDSLSGVFDFFSFRTEELESNIHLSAQIQQAEQQYLHLLDSFESYLKKQPTRIQSQLDTIEQERSVYRQELEDRTKMFFAIVRQRENIELSIALLYTATINARDTLFILLTGKNYDAPENNWSSKTIVVHNKEQTISDITLVVQK